MNSMKKDFVPIATSIGTTRRLEDYQTSPLATIYAVTTFTVTTIFGEYERSFRTGNCLAICAWTLISESVVLTPRTLLAKAAAFFLLERVVNTRLARLSPSSPVMEPTMRACLTCCTACSLLVPPFHAKLAKCQG
jgi:hypothetical protein